MITQKLHEYLRVNQAGEIAAVAMYKAQSQVFPDDHLIQNMLKHEEDHLKITTLLMIQHRARGSILNPFWSFCGYALGKVSAKLGYDIAMSATYIVEDIIDMHYKKQIDIIDDEDVKEKITICWQDEVEHKRIAADKQHPGTKNLLGRSLGGAVKLAIAIARKI